jgi:hypothetical protein
MNHELTPNPLSAEAKRGLSINIYIMLPLFSLLERGEGGGG